MKVGLQLFTVRNHFAKDPYGTLEQIAEAGYKYIEPANHRAAEDDGTGFGTPIKDFKSKIDDLGIKVVGAHISSPNEINQIREFNRNIEAWKKVVAFYAELGTPYLSVPMDYFPTLDDMKYRCESYNMLGKLLKENGMMLLYHNHYSEYMRLEGKYIMDYILENTAPDILGVELDAYWVFRGLINPAQLIRDLGDRVKIIHEKDFPLGQVNNLSAWNFMNQDVPCDDKTFHNATRPEFFTEIGDGIIKVQDVIDAGNEIGVPYILVEQDYTTMDEIDSIKRSMSNFRKMRGLEWD